MAEQKAKAPAPKSGAVWNEYIVLAKVTDLFNAYRGIKGTENVNMDITQFCDKIQFTLIDVYGKEGGEDGRT